MPASPLLHLCLHVDPGAVHGAGRSAGRDETDPAAALALWVRRETAARHGLDGQRVAGVAASIALHVAALALLVGAAAPHLPTSLGESEVDALEIEFLPAAPEPVPVAPAPAVQPKPAMAESLRVETVQAPTPPMQTAVPEPEPVTTPEAVPEPMPVPPTAPPVAAQMPAESAAAPAPDRPLTARGKRAQSQYLRELMLWLARHRVYPAEAKKHKLEGVVQVRFAIDRDGHLLSAVVHRSAGIELLDAAALDVLRRADPRPKFPKALERSRLSVTLPIDFSLITD